MDYAAADVKYLLPTKAKWHDSHLHAVSRVTQERLQGAVNAAQPAKGKHMSVRDFSLGINAQYLGRSAAIQAPKRYRGAYGRGVSLMTWISLMAMAVTSRVENVFNSFLVFLSARSRRLDVLKRCCRRQSSSLPFQRVFGISRCTEPDSADRRQEGRGR